MRGLWPGQGVDVDYSGAGASGQVVRGDVQASAHHAALVLELVQAVLRPGEDNEDIKKLAIWQELAKIAVQVTWPRTIAKHSIKDKII